VGALAGPAAAARAADQIAYGCNDDICVIDPDSGAPTNLTQSSLKTDDFPAWSPDGSRIAFRANYSNSYDIFVLNPTDPVPLTGINVTQTDDRNAEFQPPVWSSDGTRLTLAENYVSGPSSGNTDVFVSPAGGTSAPVPIGATTSYQNHPTFSPDGTKVAFDRGSPGVSIAAADGTGTAVPLTNGGGGVQPSWSPDGTRIAFLKSTASDPVIRVVKTDGSGQFVDLPFPSVIFDTPAWSADSTHLVWTGRPSSAVPDTVHVAPADGSSVGVDIPVPAGVNSPHNPSFSPDGARIAFDAGNAGGDRDIYVAQADGSDTAHAITSDGTSNLAPAWKPNAPTTTPPGTTPPGTTPPGTTPPTVVFSKFNKPKVVNGFMNAVFVSCSFGPTPNAVAAGCTFDGTGYTKRVKPHGSKAAAKPKKILFAKGSVHVADSQAAPLPLKLTHAGKKLLKPGAKLKITVTVQESRPDTVAEPETKTLKLKVPRKH
jgi:Tol biopolymer transport system component